MRVIIFILLSFSGILFSQVITFIHINDTHTHLVPYGPWLNGNREYPGGTSSATIIKNLKNQYPDAILVHSGDAFVGDLIHNVLQGRGELRFLKSLGIKIFTIGNHEFDYGPDILYNTFGQEGLPDSQTVLLSANLIYNGHPLENIIKPYWVDTVNGVIIGYVGVTTQIPTVLLPTIFPIYVDDPASYASMFSDTLNALGCDLKVLVSHIGVDADTQIAKSISNGYDLILGGHSHTKLDTPLIIRDPNGDTVWVVQAYEHYKQVGLIQMDLSSGNPKLLNYSLIPVDTSVTPDTQSLALVQEFKDSVSLWFGRDVYVSFIGYADTLIDHRFIEDSPYKDSPLGNLVTDAMRDTLNTDAGIEVHFFIGEPLYPGNFTEADLYRTVPYGYDTLTRTNAPLVRSWFYGDTLVKILNTSLNPFLYPYLLLQTSGMTYKYLSSQNQVVEVLINGNPVVPDSLYTVATTTWLLYGMDLLFDIVPEQSETTSITQFNALLNFVSKFDTLHYRTEGRIVDLDLSVQETEFSLYKEKPILPNILRGNIPLHNGVRIEIFDITGRKFASLSVLSPNVSLNKVRSGVYFLKVWTTKGKWTRKVIIFK